jgi:putative endonuclease
MTMWYLYLIRCRDGSLYTGIATDVARRFEEHVGPGNKGSKYLRGRGPLKLVYQTAFDDRSTASRAEYRVKRLSKDKKEAIVSGEIRIEDLL